VFPIVKEPPSNICGELFTKLEEYLLRPMLPLRIVECIFFIYS
jgi:hypothetical protein